MKPTKTKRHIQASLPRPSDVFPADVVPLMNPQTAVLVLGTPQRPTIELFPAGEGAVLVWGFDDPYETADRYQLCVYVTDDEAQRIFDSSATAGAIEPIRGELNNAGAVLVVTRPDGTHEARLYTIPRSVSTMAFQADLVSAAETIATYATNVVTQRKATPVSAAPSDALTAAELRAEIAEESALSAVMAALHETFVPLTFARA
ncbi:hypothetical protein [Falsarthrobacter nasiphocae]|uniref:Uncharacterized protein n=1 Tax=Falsarthrobacter nasiphocae TaxID=189863 RepID=A0AAE3YGJ4_9MICC|nr:hypothetical protein [Falsarthrobacter nasiphocae]MDR6891391.1 hypothetical protein [Falsarthrobacter nasiphocae]